MPPRVSLRPRLSHSYFHARVPKRLQVGTDKVRVRADKEWFGAGPVCLQLNSIMERVLVVDDEPDIRRMIGLILEADGYEVGQASTAEEALAEVATKAIDLAVLDIMLPGASGIELCAELKQKYPNLPVLILSALHDVQTHRRAVEAGADDYLSKPVHRGELSLRVRSLLLLRRMQRELSQQNDVLTKQRDQLVRLAAQKHELMEIVVHDLKNPLSAIVSNASFVESANTMSDDVRDAAGAITRAASNMLRMVQNLLDVAREDDVGITPHLEQCDLAGLVEKTCTLMSKRAEERKVRLSASIEAIGAVRADSDYMRRVLENLLDNALRYTPRGGSVTVNLGRADADLVLSVADTGPGIPDEHKARVFDKYAQLDRSIDRAQQRFGRGLGLTFCRLVAEAHGGRIWVEDAEPKGARFCLRFPAGN